MFIVPRQALATATGTYRARVIYDVPDDVGQEWTDKGLATKTSMPPQYIQELYQRLGQSSGKPCFFLPFVGEFGHEIMSHIRLVHFSSASEKLVCCKQGHQALYPSAAMCITDWEDPVADAQRVATMRSTPLPWRALRQAYGPPARVTVESGGLTPEQEIFPIQPHERIPFKPRLRGYTADVLLGVRRRDFCPERNWPHWQAVADALTAAGLTFAVVGTRETSLQLRGQLMHTSGDTDAAIELMQNCRLYVGTDTGSSHLAAAVGAPMLVFRETRSGSRDLTGHMAQINPNRVEVLAGGWEHPERVIGRVSERAAGR